MRGPPSDLSNQELREKYESLRSIVDNDTGYSVSDLRYLKALEQEIEERGGQFQQQTTVTFPEEKQVNPE